MGKKTKRSTKHQQHSEENVKALGVEKSPRKSQHHRKKSDDSLVQKNVKSNESVILPEVPNKDQPSKQFYTDLVVCIKEWEEQRRLKTKPESIFRKHISWRSIMESMEKKGHTVKDQQMAKRHWLLICRNIKVERPLGDLLSECNGSIERMFKIPTQSGYSIFQSEERKKVRAKNPDLSFVEVHKKISSHWKKLSEDQKVSYHEKAAEENLKNGIPLSRKRKLKLAQNTKSSLITADAYNYPTTVLRDFYISVKAHEMKTEHPELSYKERRTVASTSFSQCSFDELTAIKKQYAEHLQEFIDRVKKETPELIQQIARHIMETKRLRPLLEQPVVSLFLSGIKLNDAPKSKKLDDSALGVVSENKKSSKAKEETVSDNSQSSSHADGDEDLSPSSESSDDNFV